MLDYHLTSIFDDKYVSVDTAVRKVLELGRQSHGRECDLGKIYTYNSSNSIWCTLNHGITY